MKKVFCVLLVCVLLCGCSVTVTDLSHEIGHSGAGNNSLQTTGPTLPENPYGPMDFGFEGDYLACFAGQAMLGIDVSYWQGGIDWQQVKDAGIE